MPVTVCRHERLDVQLIDDGLCLVTCECGTKWLEVAMNLNLPVERGAERTVV